MAGERIRKNATAEIGIIKIQLVIRVVQAMRELLIVILFFILIVVL